MADVSMTCEEILDLPAAERLHEELLGAAARGAEAELEITADAVLRVSTAALQVLCAAIRDARTQGRALRLVRPSAALRDAARRLGLTAALELDPLDQPVGAVHAEQAH
jgi:anti-anti-sigma regulatory factor